MGTKKEKQMQKPSNGYEILDKHFGGWGAGIRRDQSRNETFIEKKLESEIC
jgi:hypothetical protein